LYLKFDTLPRFEKELPLLIRTYALELKNRSSKYLNV
jgi:hypothetical protein